MFWFSKESVGGVGAVAKSPGVVQTQFWVHQRGLAQVSHADILSTAGKVEKPFGVGVGFFEDD